MSRRTATTAVVGAAVLLGACAGGGGMAGETVTASPVVTTVTSTNTVANTSTVAGVASPATVTVTATPSEEPAAGACEPSMFSAEFTEPVVLFCDGQWVRAGQAQTDWVQLYRYVDDRWEEHTHDGRSELTGYTCYEESRLRANGAPEELLGQALLCE